ncbi:MAG TPA: 3-oxoadipate--succinyl-CoA transferase subunit B, partial [Methylomirabilota bacterium]|nr:3-oxoadipate--succinyl-CoA transferase subunit B [Methylomirabilota bacterium]
MAVVLSRRLRDGELGAIVGWAPVAMAAYGLAQRSGRWTSWLALPAGAFDPRSDRLMDGADERLLPTASAVLDLAEVLDAVTVTPHFLDVAILAPLQVDRFGNVNTVCRGDPARPSLRGPGTLLTSALAGLSRRFMIVLDRHDPETLLERLDFCSGTGHHRGGRTR